ncbi:MAG: hypothetical protein MZV65_39820 [Chromatiales bacterium]|nr:hypothetical protein [Chromatiales bacterium]
MEHLRLCEHLGVGSAIRAGLRYALRRGYRHRGARGWRRAASGRRDRRARSRRSLAGRADAVVGSRFGDPAGYQTPPGLRRVGQRVLSAWVSAASGVRVTDATSGFWAFGARAIALLADEHPPGYPEPELLLLLARSGIQRGRGAHPDEPAPGGPDVADGRAAWAWRARLRPWRCS